MNGFNQERRIMSDVQEYKRKMIELKKLGAESDEYKRLKTEVDTKYTVLENEIREMLEADGENSFKCEEGTIYLSFIDQVSMPKDPIQKEAFYNYLREKGLYDEMISVNSQKLNGFYRKEAEAAKDAGDILFSMPGIEQIHTVTRIGFRKS